MLLNRGSGAEASLAEVVAFWIFKFNSARRARDPAQALTELFSSDPWWRDHLALTWDLRTFHTLALILDFLRETLERTGCGPFCLVSNSVQLVQMGGQISFVYASFTFETNYATCSGGLKLLPGPRGQWHAWNVYTRIEELKGHEQNLRRLSLRDTQVDTDFDVVVLGSGQCGLQIAAASKAIGMRVLIVEQNGRLGDQWRRHYDSLRLHRDSAQFLYRPFPPSMPLYPSKNDIADFLEHYAQVCNLNVLCSSWIQNATFDHDSETWVLDVRHRHRSSSRIRTGQLVFATGILGSSPTTLDIPDKSSYPGCVLHSVQYKSGSGWRGKRAIVVGAGTSGHDIAEDLYSHGADVLIVQRSSTAVVSKKLAIMYFAQHYPAGSSPDNVDRALESTPVLLNRQLAAAAAGFMEQVDAPLRAGLARAGFLFTDPDAAQMLYGRFGGYYVDTGCSGLIIEGKIKLKADIPIMSFTQRGLRFADGVEAPAELIVFATGYDTGTMRALAIQLVGPEIGGVLKEPWGMDEEGEVNAVWRNSGREHACSRKCSLPNNLIDSHLWYHGGDFKAARYCAFKMLASLVY